VLAEASWSWVLWLRNGKDAGIEKIMQHRGGRCTSPPTTNKKRRPMSEDFCVLCPHSC